jgi:ribosomal protein S18 acetylase RimI-like enzyme
MTGNFALTVNQNSSMDIVIKPFDKKYLDPFSDIHQIDKEAFGKENTWSIDNFLYERNLKDYLSCLAFHGGNLVGFNICSSYSNEPKLKAHINRIAVLRELKNKQIGKKLIDYFERKVSLNNIPIITLEFDKGLCVERFYESCGYSQITNEIDILNYLEEKNKENKKDLFLSFTRKIYEKKLRFPLQNVSE